MAGASSNIGKEYVRDKALPKLLSRDHEYAITSPPQPSLIQNIDFLTQVFIGCSPLT